jgi:hypothetical protein
MGTSLASFVASGFILWRIQLRKIMAVCALLQRMGIFRCGAENIAANSTIFKSKAAKRANLFSRLVFHANRYVMKHWNSRFPFGNDRKKCKSKCKCKGWAGFGGFAP